MGFAWAVSVFRDFFVELNLSEMILNYVLNVILNIMIVIHNERVCIDK